MAVLTLGSSPLSRGIHSPRRVAPAGGGIIPALAGNTRAPWPGICRSRDHPRSRGEYIGVHRWAPRARGSSPLSRGIRVRLSVWRDRIGIIPALAGNTPVSGAVARPTGDHPRSRGEYPCVAWVHFLPQGSSPLSRGIHPADCPGRWSSGIIPALAGNTGTRNRIPLRRPGSSPLSRGIRIPYVRTTEITGIIPALAGNTACWREVSLNASDHPRSRGEYPHIPHQRPVDQGSSPLSRGIHGRRT